MVEADDQWILKKAAVPEAQAIGHSKYSNPFKVI
jgi:hypothetical protein